MLEDDLEKIVRELKKDDIERWSRRVDKDKYYDVEYRPKKKEIREVEELAEKFSSSSLPKNENHERIYKCLLPPINERKSVVLKREPVIYRAEGIEMIVELVLLNHSFIVKLLPEKKEDKPKSDIEKTTQMVLGMTKKFTENVNTLLGKKSVENCFKLSSIIGIVEGDKDSKTFNLIVKNHDNKTVFVPQITCHTSERMHAWLDALKLSVMENCEGKEEDSLNITVKSLNPSQGWYWRTTEGDETIMRQSTTLTQSSDEDFLQGPEVEIGITQDGITEDDLSEEEKFGERFLDDLSFGTEPSAIGGLPPQVMQKLSKSKCFLLFLLTK